MKLLHSRVAWILSFFYLSYYALLGIYIIFLPKMLTLEGYTPAQVGAIFAAGPMMRFILPFVFRRIGGIRRRTYLGALIATFAAALLLIPSLKSFTALFLANLVYGAAMGIILPYVDTIALQVIGKERYGRVRLWGSVGFIAIALWLGRVLQTPLQSLSYLATLAFVTLIGGWLLVRYDQPDPDSTIARGRLSLSRYWAFWLSTLLLQVSFGGFYNFFTIYETAHGISLEVTSWLWSFGVLCEIAMLYWQGPLLKYNLQGVLEFTVATAVVRWAMLWLWPDSLFVAFASQSLHAFNFALYYTAAIAYVYTLYEQKKLAQQFFLGISFGLGGSLGALVAGWVYDWRPDALFLFEAFVALAAWGTIRIHRLRRSTHGL